MAEIPQEEPNLKVPPPVDQNLVHAAMAVLPAAVGAGVGILIGAHLSKKGRERIASSLFAMGAMAAVPVAVDCVAKLVSGPASRAGTQRTLAGIRGSVGVPYEDGTNGAPPQQQPQSRPADEYSSNEFRVS